MSLYESLDAFVGAGVLAAAPALGVTVPPGAVATGGAFSALLRGRGEAAPLGTVLDALARDVWLSQETLGVPHSVAEEHAVKLVVVLEQFRPEPEQIGAAIEKSRSGLAGHANGTAPAHRKIAEGIIERAGADALKQAGVWSEVATFLLERLYAHLIDDPGLMASLQPFIAEHLATLAAGPARKGSTRSTGSSRAADNPAQLARGDEAGAADNGTQAAISAIRERYGLGEAALARFMAVLDKAGIAEAERLSRLEDMAAWLQSTHDQLVKPSNEDADTRRLKTQAAALLVRGELEAAVDVLKQVKRKVRDGRRRIEARLEEEMQSLRRQMGEESLACVGLAEIALARLDFAAAADLFAEAADCLPGNDADTILSLTMRQADALLQLGTGSGDVAALMQSKTVYADALRAACEADNARAAAAAHHALGNVYFRLAGHGSADKWLREAVGAYRHALKGIAREREPRLYAMTELHLGHALSTLGEGTGDATHWREAAAAYRAALLELTVERAPADWAAAQAGLGNALLNLEGLEPSREILLEAERALRGALQVLTRERAPGDWATAQMNLGSALLALGEKDGMSERVEEAVGAYRQALTVFTREKDAQAWSLAQMNLANALASLGERDRASRSRLEEAAATYREALEVLSREATPLRWAVTQMNLGTVLIRLGEAGDKRRNWLAAAAAMVPALEVFETHGADDYAALTRRNLRRFHEQWDSLIGGDAPDRPTSTRDAS